MNLPHDTGTLVDYLNELFPPRCIRKGESLEDAHRYAGKRELIEYVMMRYTEETSNAS